MGFRFDDDDQIPYVVEESTNSIYQPVLELQLDDLDGIVQVLVRNVGILTIALIIIYHIMVSKSTNP